MVGGESPGGDRGLADSALPSAQFHDLLHVLNNFSPPLDPQVVRTRDLRKPIFYVGQVKIVTPNHQKRFQIGEILRTVEDHLENGKILSAQEPRRSAFQGKLSSSPVHRLMVLPRWEVEVHMDTPSRCVGPGFLFKRAYQRGSLEVATDFRRLKTCPARRKRRRSGTIAETLSACQSNREEPLTKFAGAHKIWGWERLP